MSKPTTLKDALAKWEDRNKQPAATATDIGLQFQYPPIEKMDPILNSLTECQKLSLSSNMIEKITGISGMKNLKVLSLARNNLKTLNTAALIFGFPLVIKLAKPSFIGVTSCRCSFQSIHPK